MGTRAVFEVRDDGCGVPRERLRTLFSGALPSDDDHDPHGGEIKAESKPGEGLTIRFWLEAEPPETDETEEPEDEQ